MRQYLHDFMVSYDYPQEAVETLLGQLSAMVVTAEYTQDSVQLRIQAGCKEKIKTLPAFTFTGGSVTCEAQDEDLIIQATVQGGAQA